MAVHDESFKQNVLPQTNEFVFEDQSSSNDDTLNAENVNDGKLNNKSPKTPILSESGDVTMNDM